MQRTMELEKYLKGDKEYIEIAKIKVREMLARCAADAKRQQGCVFILRYLSAATATPEGIHYADYCDILEELAPYLKPSSNVPMWEKYLEFLRYFHHQMLEKRLYVEASRVFHHLCTQENDMLQLENHYNYIQAIYAQHLHVQRGYLQIDESRAQADINDALNALTKLYDKMLECNNMQNFFYPNIALDFTLSFFSQRKQSTLTFLATLPNGTQMFDSFFRLLTELRMPETTTAAELNAQFQHHLDLVLIFMKMDEMSNMEQQLALKHLTACCDSNVFLGEQTLRYIFSLLRTLVSFIYTPGKVRNFQSSFPELCEKFTRLITSNGAMWIKQEWFMDVIVALLLIMTTMQENAITCYCKFWQQMDTVQCFLVYSQLSMNCIKLSAQITTTRLLTLNCCTSVRKHVAVRYAQLTLAVYGTFLLNLREIKESDQPALKELNNNIMVTMRHALLVLNTMSCITTWESHDLRSLIIYFYQLKDDLQSPALAPFCISLGELFQLVRDKIETKMHTLLHSMYKMSLLTEDTRLIAEMRSIYIAQLLVKDDSAQPDASTTRNNVMDFYSTGGSANKNEPSNQHSSILDIYEQSKQPLKPNLELQHKRQLFYMEVQAIQRYQRENAQLQLNLMRRRCTVYDLAYAAHCFAKRKTLLEEEVMNMLKCARTTLANKSTSGEITRLEQLSLGIICTVLLQQQLKEKKKQVIALNLEIKCIDKLENVIHNPCFQNVNINNEMETIKCALQALNAFEEFYYKADLSHITINDACIDWDIILYDLADTALYLQFACYMEHAVQAWLLHYRISQTIQDDYNLMRGLAFFCEHAAYFTTYDTSRFDLAHEVNLNVSTIVNVLPNLSAQLKRNQNFTLICIAQLAYYYAYLENFVYAAKLLCFVYEKHQELAGEDESRDVVLITLNVVKFRIIWRHYDVGREEFELFQSNLLHDLKATMHTFCDTKQVSSVDSMIHTILLADIVQEFSECSANRLFDSNISSYYGSLFKIALTMGAAMRLIQLLTASFWMNLQMELIPKAQLKLTLIQYLLGLETFEVLESLVKSRIAEKKDDEMLFAGISENLCEMETVRKTAGISTTPSIQCPIYTQQKPSTRILDIFRNFEGGNKERPENTTLAWTGATLGVLYARYCFLRKDGIQLDEMYTTILEWLEPKKYGTLLSLHSSHLQLLCMQHFANYLRSQMNYTKAMDCIQNALSYCKTQRKNVDFVYEVNFQLQLQAIKLEMKKEQQQKQELQQQEQQKPQQYSIKKMQLTPSKPDLSKKLSPEETKNLRRALKFSPEQRERRKQKNVETIQIDGEIKQTDAETRQMMRPKARIGIRIASNGATRKKVEPKLPSIVLNDAQFIDLDSSSEEEEEACVDNNNIEEKITHAKESSEKVDLKSSSVANTRKDRKDRAQNHGTLDVHVTDLIEENENNNTNQIKNKKNTVQNKKVKQVSFESLGLNKETNVNLNAISKQSTAAAKNNRTKLPPNGSEEEEEACMNNNNIEEKITNAKESSEKVDLKSSSVASTRKDRKDRAQNHGTLDVHVIDLSEENENNNINQIKNKNTVQNKKVKQVSFESLGLNKETNVNLNAISKQSTAAAKNNRTKLLPNGNAKNSIDVTSLETRTCATTSNGAKATTSMKPNRKAKLETSVIPATSKPTDGTRTAYTRRNCN